jgi:DNA polymerase-3 subunit delta'
MHSDGYNHMSWNSIIGQKRVKQTIERFLSQNRLPHALLFYGPKGVGKDAVAIQLAKVINCSSKSSDSCNKCPDCQKFDSLQHPNLHLVFPLPVGKNESSDNSPIEKLSSEELSEVQSEIGLKSKNLYHNITLDRANIIKMTSIREIRRKSSLSVYEKGKRVIVIVNADKMNDEASNALLKTLEEPLDNTLLILTTSNKDALLTTIISRCQLVRFDELSEYEISEALHTKANIDEQQARIISRLANGSYSRALDLTGSELNSKRILVVDFLVAIITQNTLNISREVEKLTKEFNRSEIEQILLLMQMWFRDANAIRLGSEKVYNIDQISRIEKFVSKYTNINYSDTHEIIEKSLSLLKKNVYINLILMTLVIDIKRILK